jgi:hypothetical protein
MAKYLATNIPPAKTKLVTINNVTSFEMMKNRVTSSLNHNNFMKRKNIMIVITDEDIKKSFFSC